jgi:hypothetical protein
VFLLRWSCNELLLPVGIPPSELSDTRKPSHNEKEINWIGRIEVGQVLDAWDAWRRQIGSATSPGKPENMLFGKTVITFRG